MHYLRNWKKFYKLILFIFLKNNNTIWSISASYWHFGVTSIYCILTSVGVDVTWQKSLSLFLSMLNENCQSRNARLSHIVFSLIHFVIYCDAACVSYSYVVHFVYVVLDIYTDACWSGWNITNALVTIVLKYTKL